MADRLRIWKSQKLMMANCIVAAALLNMSDAKASAHPSVVVRQITPKAYFYAPADITGAAPLIVLLHGAGGDARSFIGRFKQDADERGILLLSIQSSDRTWARRKPGDDDTDVANIKAAIDSLSAKDSIAPGETSIMGFSDGASYALSVGLAYPDIFHTIVAFSPGYAFAPKQLEIRQRIFIAHSRRDPILPAQNTRRMVEELQRAGYAPEVHWFNGGHEIDPQLKKAALDFALAH